MCHGWHGTGLVALATRAIYPSSMGNGFPAPSCPLGHQLPSTVPTPLPDRGPAGMLTPGALAGGEEGNFLQHRLRLVQTLH